MKIYPFRYNKPRVGDTCWFLSDKGPILSKIECKHDHYFNMDPLLCDRGNQENYLIDYWIDNYPYHGLIFGEDLFEEKEECLTVLEEEDKVLLESTKKEGEI